MIMGMHYILAVNLLSRGKILVHFGCIPKRASGGLTSVLVSGFYIFLLICPKLAGSMTVVKMICDDRANIMY